MHGSGDTKGCREERHVSKMAPGEAIEDFRFVAEYCVDQASKPTVVDRKHILHGRHGSGLTRRQFATAPMQHVSTVVYARSTPVVPSSAPQGPVSRRPLRLGISGIQSVLSKEALSVANLSVTSIRISLRSPVRSGVESHDGHRTPSVFRLKALAKHLADGLSNP